MANSQARALELVDGDDFKENHQERERLRTVTAFFIFGTLLYANFILVITAAQDILAGTLIQTSMVLVASTVPNFLTVLLAPYFMQKIPYSARITLACLLEISGFLLLAFVKQVHWKLIGVGIISIGFGVGETTVLALSSFYHEVTTTAFSAGTGVGLVIAPLYYTAMTTWFCVSPNATILIMAAMLFLMFVCYYAMDKKHLESPSPLADEHTGVQYTVLETNDKGCNNSNKDDESKTGNGSLSTREKFLVICQMLPNLLPIFIAWFSEYLIIQAVLTTLAFPNAPFKPRDHYEYYIFVLMGGEAVGRSYLVALSYIKAEWAVKAKFPYLWFLSMIQVIHLLFFILAAWYRFLPSVWIVLLLSFTCGVAIGVFYANATTFFRDRFDDRHKEFAMGYIIVAIAGGVLAAALLGLSTEPLLREHCTMLVNNTDFCFTRSKSVDRFTSSCLLTHN
ncbi:battenin CLN3 protein [Desmophyllum pertusum]|uniref:Battenin n=1 Tax=Desmophyllum pertusum TaxID=174260 RepID=A0A9W9ZQB8_9CNID|nr:battenin CLN3 protein [Desmophyllum pertusum]